MKKTLSVSVDGAVVRKVGREAQRDGLSVSAWVSNVLERELRARAYRRAAAERTALGIDSDERLAAYAARRAAIKADRDG